MAVAGGVDAAAAPASSVVSAQQIAAINDGKLVASETGPTITGVTPAKLQQYLYELCRAVSQGELAPDKFADGVRCAGAVADGCGAAVVDVLWMSWLQAAGGVLPAATPAPAGDEEGPRERLVALLQDLLKQGMVTKRQVMETADDDFLEAGGLVVSAAAWHKKGIRVNTKAVYTQQKFNLLREESEGFSKLLAVLNRFGAAALSPASVPGLVLEVKALIGYFDLDPNRAVALALQAFASQPANAAYLPLFRLFVPDSVGQTLGFLFQHAQAAGATPDSLFAVAVALMQAGTVSLEAVMGHLAPADEAMAAAAKDAVAALAREIRGIGVISLSATAAEPQQQEAGQPRGPAVLTSGTLRLDVGPMAAAARAPLAANNQKLGLLAALLRAGDWERASTLMGWLAASGVAPAAHPPVAAALAADAARLLAPLLAAAQPKAPPPAAPQTLPDDLMDRLRTLGPYIAVDVALMARLSRALRFVLGHSLAVAAADASSAAASMVAQVEEVIGGVLLPGMLLTGAVPAVACEIYGALSALPYTRRYRLYSELRETTKATPILTASAKLAVVELKKVLRRVHAPENAKDKKGEIKMFGRMLAKIAAANPLAVAQLVIAQVEAYPNMVEPYVEALRYLTPLGFDVLTFAIIDRLAGSGREKLKQDGVNIADWLTALALFTGHAAKAWAGVDVAALAQYLTHTLRSGQAFDLLLLKELVSVMTGTVTVLDLSQEQVDGMAGGDTLRTQTLAFGVVRNAKQLQRGAARLLSALQQGPREQQLALPLLLLLGQQLRVIALQTESPHLKLVAELYDKASQTLLQFGDFLKGAMAPADYAQLLPPLESLVGDYGMGPEAAFQLYRPIIARVIPPTPEPAKVDTKPEDGEVAAEEGEIEVPKPAAPEPGEVPSEVAAAADGQLAWPAVAASVRAVLPAAVWDIIPVELYTTFWSLSLYDIHVPVDSYQREMSRLTVQLRNKKEAVRAAERDAEARRRGYMVEDAVMAAHPDIPTAQKEIQRTEHVLEKLPAELKAQQKNHAAVAARLRAQSDAWLRNTPGLRHFADTFVLHCIMPRLKHSAADAMFCAKFIHRLHTLNAWGFPSIQIYDKVIKDMVELVLCSTDAEAANLGLFLQHTLSLMAHWRGSARVYAEECAASPCFAINFTQPSSRRTSYEEFRKLNSKWQHKLGKIFRTALDSGEYVHIRNSLIILNKIVKVFPEMGGVASHLQQATAKLRDTEAREDLKTQANMYNNTLTAQFALRTLWAQKDYLDDPDVVAKRRAAKATTAAEETKPAAKTSRKPAKADEPAASGREAGSSGAKAEARAKAADAKKPAEPKATREVDRPASRTDPDPAERPAKPAAEPSKPADRAAARAAGRAAGKAADAAAASAAEPKAGRAAEAEGQPKEAGRRKESADAGNGLSKRTSSRADAADAAAAAATPTSASSREGRPAADDGAAPIRSEARRVSSSALRVDAPEFTPPGLAAGRAKGSRPAAEQPEGSADRAAKRPRTSDAASAAEAASKGDGGKTAPLGTARLRAAAGGDAPDAKAAVVPSKRKQEAPALDTDTGRSIAARLSGRSTADAGSSRTAAKLAGAAKPEQAADRIDADAAPAAAEPAKRKQDAAPAAEPQTPQPRRKHEKVVFVPSDKRTRDEAAPAPADAPPEEGKQRGRDKNMRRGDADAEAQPAAPPSEFSSSLRAELAQRLGGLASKARAAANEIIADDPSMRPVAADGHSIPVRLGDLSDGTLRQLDTYISSQEAADAPAKERKRARDKSKERTERAPKDKRSRHHRDRGDDARSVRSSERGSPTPAVTQAPAEAKPSKERRHEKAPKAEKAEKAEKGERRKDKRQR